MSLEKPVQEAVLRLMAWNARRHLIDEGYDVTADLKLVLDQFQVDVKKGPSNPLVIPDGLTVQGQAVLTLAQGEAERSHHSYIGTEHLLLALFLAGGRASKALESLGVEILKVRQVIDAVLGRNERIIIQQIIPTSRVKKVISIAHEEAQRTGHARVGSDHLLLGLLIEGEGIAAHVLEDLGATLDKVRDALGQVAFVEDAA